MKIELTEEQICEITKTTNESHEKKLKQQIRKFERRLAAKDVRIDSYRQSYLRTKNELRLAERVNKELKRRLANAEWE